MTILLAARRAAERLLSAYVSRFPHVKGTIRSGPYWEARDFLSRPSIRATFPASAAQFECDAPVECILATWYRELRQHLATSTALLPARRIELDKLPTFNVDQLHTDLDGSNSCLREIASLVRSRSELFHLALMNGSIGSNDYKPGWSDVDLFCVLSQFTVEDPTGIRQAAHVISEANREVYIFNILQLHKIFVSSEIALALHTPAVLPLVCVENGSVLTCDSAELVVREADEWAESRAYFMNDIVRSSRTIAALSRSSPLDKALMLHRVFAFPYAFLQCVGIMAYKRESFRLISEHFDTLFPGIREFYGPLRSFYDNWSVPHLNTLAMRRVASRIASPVAVNRALVYLEPAIMRGLEQGYNLLAGGEIRRFLGYLDAAESYLLKDGGTP